MTLPSTRRPKRVVLKSLKEKAKFEDESEQVFPQSEISIFAKTHLKL